jgi:hypothetical protein
MSVIQSVSLMAHFVAIWRARVFLTIFFIDFRGMNYFKLVLTLMVLPAMLVHAQDWQPKTASLMTPYAKDVDPKNVLPEYPRPQMERQRWLNLNGVWQFQPATKDETRPSGPLSRTILVPFPVESALSGVQEHHDRLWYRRTFTIPKDWGKDHVILHFGAVDYRSEVFINGKSLGVHEGGYDPFSFDITSFINRPGEQEIIVNVFDPTDNGGYPRGKQTLNPRGIMYTSVTGIWQTVWLEPVPATHISDIHMTPDIDQHILKLLVNADGMGTVTVKVKDGDNTVTTLTGKANQEMTVAVPHARLWSPDQPFLYGLEITLGKDAITSYFGMRKISVENEGGYRKLFLNNKFLFQLGPLDQGFWPDGGYTAPTDAALKHDLQLTKDFGFNMVRKHIKVEPYRWYYWADKLGLMVWQDMPSPNSYTEHTPSVDTAAFARELTRLVKTHWNSPCIVTWVIYNEEQAQHNTPGYVKMVHALDPSRLINQASGGKHFGVGDLLDIHSYPPPAVPQSTTQALACGEYGGIGYKIKGHMWQEGDTYVMISDVDEYTALYNRFANDLTTFKTNNGLSAAVYTEITDVEGELNGLVTYDRSVIKGPVEKIRASNQRVIHGNIRLTEVLASSLHTGHTWKYTFDAPDSSWAAGAYNDDAWKSGEAGFGTKGTPGAVIRTTWDTKDIWLRQAFTLGTLANIKKEDLMLYIHHDDDCEVYINGVMAAKIPAYTSGYSMMPINAAGRNALVAGGKNIIAVHCRQRSGGQYIDAGISAMTVSQ